MKLFQKTGLWHGLTAVTASLLVIILCVSPLAFDNYGQVNRVLGILDGPTGASAGSMVFKTAFSEDGALSDESLARLLTAEDLQAVTEQEEGSVLLTNNGALPLSGEERRVTLFGRATADPLYRGRSGGPDIDVNDPRLVSLREALEAEGFVINDTLFAAYENSGTRRSKYGNDVLANGNSNPASIGEEDISFYTDALRASYADDYNDVAIVMFARESGEGTDFVFDPVHEADGVPALSLHKQEADLLRMIKESGKFAKTIVLINSGNVMDLGWLYDEQYGVDACLWIGGTGIKGFTGVANLLTGKANPSGKLVDTYASSGLSSPAMQNFGSFSWENLDHVKELSHSSDSRNEAYIVEAEGIYYGYKYYESRYNDSVLGQFNADSTVGRTVTLSEGGATKTLYEGDEGWNYAAEVVFPFGYGLSYTSFTQEIVPDSFRYDETTDEFTIQVRVKNTGSVSGKNVVQLYVQVPYTDYDRENLVEKSAVQLVGFTKTGMLAPGAEETVAITVDRYLLASYDENGSKHYILDEGNYYFAIGEDVHDALNNILAKKAENEMIVDLKLYDAAGNAVAGDPGKAVIHNESVFDDQSYRNSKHGNGIEVTNAMNGRESTDVNDFIDGAVTYLTRGGRGNDWSTSFPAPVKLTASDEMIDILNGKSYSTPENAPAKSSFAMGVDAGLSLYDMREVPFESEQWDTFLDQFSLGQLLTIESDNYGSKAIEGSINKPATKIGDGPDGNMFHYLYGDKGVGTCYPNQVVLASTWNIELIGKRGDFLAEDAMHSGVNVLCAPGANLHRTAYGGRNYEYFSEDAIFTYLCVSAECKAMQEKGMLAEIKHFVANDQESNRNGVATFMTEQRYRQEQLKAFEGAFTKGGALATMGSLNRVGMVAASASRASLTQILRGEWGFQGAVITDSSVASKSYIHSIECLVAGSDYFCLDTRTDDIRNAINSGDGYILQALREANKHYYYAYSRSNLMNGLAERTASADLYWWMIAIYAVEGVLGAAAAGSITMYFLGVFMAKRKKKEGETQ